eukprot:TRINITY_DN10898_c0_g1_i1.p2 TRINITY_DN10898_c0_g1~~TRINITY_DN10898_c0_g1_i1.p2  ORF type:complete len:122 (+),score=18.17 TRINITY_DN10898_c0_g1_i1:326-691(+)
MPNCNSRVRDSPLDADWDAPCDASRDFSLDAIHDHQYNAQLDRKWRAALVAAACFTEADVLVVPDAGCGVFQNPPEAVGAAFGRILAKEFNGRFSEVLIAYVGGTKGQLFEQAARHAFASP